MRSAYLSGAASLGFLTLMILIVGLPTIYLGEWSRLFHLTEPHLIVQARSALAVVVIFFAAGLPLNATARLAASVQKGWIHASWIAIGSVISLALVVLATRVGAGLTAFLAFACLAPLIQGVGLHFHMLHTLGWSHARPPFLSRAERRRLFATSFLFSAPQLGLALVQALPPVALTMTAGPVSAGAFNILQRLFSPLSQGQQLLLAPLWPALAEAHARGDAAWLQRGLRFSLMATALFAGGLAGVAWQAPRLISWWIGRGTEATEPMLRAMTALWSIALMAGQPLLYFLLGVGRLRGLAVYGTVGYGLAMAALVAAGYRWGASGALAGAAVSYSVVVLTGMGIETRLALRAALSHHSAKAAP
jgi:O-antigen/teichoic acid export membrane protein